MAHVQSKIKREDLQVCTILKASSRKGGGVGVGGGGWR